MYIPLLSLWTKFAAVNQNSLLEYLETKHYWALRGTARTLVHRVANLPSDQVAGKVSWVSSSKKSCFPDLKWCRTTILWVLEPGVSPLGDLTPCFLHRCGCTGLMFIAESGVEIRLTPAEWSGVESGVGIRLTPAIPSPWWRDCGFVSLPA